jgi:hypothetical protein
MTRPNATYEVCASVEILDSRLTHHREAVLQIRQVLRVRISSGGLGRRATMSGILADSLFVRPAGMIAIFARRFDILLRLMGIQPCQIEYLSSDSDVGMPCGKTAVGKCADCGAAICSDCQLECCGDSFCELCYDYHVTHSCLRKPVQNEREPLLTFRPTPNKAS